MAPKKDKPSNNQENLEGDEVSGDNKTGDASSKEDIASGPSAVREATSSTSEDEMENEDQRANEGLEKTTKQAEKTIGQPQGTQNSDPKSKEPLQTPPATNNSITSDTTGKEPASLKNICNYVVILLVLAFIAVFAAIILAPPEPEVKTDFDLPKIFENKLMELQTSFTNQTDRFWRIVKNRGLAHLRNTNPPQPLVLLLAAPPAAHGVVDCLARKLAEVLDPKNKRTLAKIDGTEEKRFAGEKAKKKMDELLINKFKAGHRVALIHHLELLPPPSPLLFYSYCDDQNAPHKHVAIIFTVHLPAEPDASLSPSEAEGTVEKYLSSEVWVREDQDAVAALLSRVADTVALMNGEPDSVKASC